LKLTIKARLIVLLVVPILGTGFLSVQGLIRANQTANEMSDLEVLSRLAVRIGATVHETQKERGRTAGFLGSKGAKFKTELPAQHQDTDKRIAELQSFLDDFDASIYGKDFQAALSQANGDLARIRGIRQQVSALRVSAPQAIGYYTTMNGRFLDVIGTMTKQSSDAEMTVMIGAYVSFLKGKERAGVERAVMANTFASDKFDTGIFRKFISLVTQQDTYMGEFQLAATEDAVAFYQDKMKDEVVTQVQRYRDTAIVKSSEGRFGVEVGVWIDTITAKINLLKQTEDWLADQLAVRAGEVKAAATRAEVTLALMSAVVIGLAVVGGFLVIRSIIKPIKLLVDRTEQIASGDLTGESIEVKSKDELGTLAHASNEMQEKLRKLVSEVGSTSHEVAGAATQIAASSEEMAQGMGEQNEQVTQIASAVEEMSSSIIEVARKSTEAAGNAQQSGRVAEEGGRVVSETIDGMNEISQAVSASAESVSELGKRGEQIGQIIEVINDIADQTNLLALNAAIEAARAGEHGRGFAVVADEVRKLADRTTKATEEIGESITAIQTETDQAVQRMTSGKEQVKVGVEKATQAGESLDSIVAGAQDVSGMIQSIAAAAEEQSAASEQVSRGIQSVSAITSQSAEAASQSAMAASQLSTKAEELQLQVGKFKV
jgi:methyl-accepting chemotaxis protein